MTKKTSRIWRIPLLGVFLFLSACATHQSRIREPMDQLQQGQFDPAIETLSKLAEKPSDDQLLYLMEQGTALQMAGRYQESTDVFLKADRLIDQVDYHSVSNITMATLGSEEMIQYKGESYEKLFIHTSLALNFMMMGKFDEALVEARRINERVNKFRQDGRKDYEYSPFSHFLSGLMWESDQKYDDAIIEFEKAYKLDGSIPYLPQDLIRVSKKARREESHRKWKSEFPQVSEGKDWYDKNKGEVVLIFEQGWGPRKDYGVDRRVPKLYPRFSQTQKVRVQLKDSSNDKSPLIVSESSVVYNVQDVAIRTLDADYGWLVARKVGAFVAKEVVADQIRQKNELLGFAAWIGMHLSDRADLRHWVSLPQTIQMVRLWLPPGTYTVDLQGLDGGGGPTADRKEKISLKVQSGRKTFYFWRTLR